MISEDLPQTFVRLPHFMLNRFLLQFFICADSLFLTHYEIYFVAHFACPFFLFFFLLLNSSLLVEEMKYFCM